MRHDPRLGASDHESGPPISPHTGGDGRFESGRRGAIASKRTETALKINVTLSIEISPEEIGAGLSTFANRQDLKDYVLNAVQQAPRILDTEAEVTLK